MVRGSLWRERGVPPPATDSVADTDVGDSADAGSSGSTTGSDSGPPDDDDLPDPQCPGFDVDEEGALTLDLAAVRLGITLTVDGEPLRRTSRAVGGGWCFGAAMPASTLDPDSPSTWA